MDILPCWTRISVTFATRHCDNTTYRGAVMTITVVHWMQGYCSSGGPPIMTTFTFRTQAHWTTQRRGIVEAESIPRTIDFSAPKEFGGEPCLWTPEHFLLAAVSTCFVSTLRAIAEASKLPFSDLQVSTEGTCEKLPGGYRVR